MTSDANPQYKMLTSVEHVLQRPSVWAGCDRGVTITKAAHNFDIVEGNIITFSEKTPVCKLLLKIFDEILVNALDQAQLNTKVNLITVTFDNGVISIENNGGSLPMDNDNTHNIPIIEMIFFRMFAGSNFTKSGANTTVGGLNGIGAKLAVIFSKWFEVRTYNHTNSKIYSQRAENNLSKICPPTITKEKIPGGSFVRISFLPDYAALGAQIVSNESCTGSDSGDFDSWRYLFRRCVYAALCTNALIVVNNTVKNINRYELRCKISDIAKLICPDIEFMREMFKVDGYLWELIIVVNNSKCNSLSFVNGCHTTGGTHIDAIVKTIHTAIAARLKKAFKIDYDEKAIGKMLTIFLVSIIPNPDYNAQSKDSLISPKTFELTKQMKPFNEFVYSKICDINDAANTSITNKRIAKTVKAPGYHGADYAGTKKSAQCRLFIPEGNSAETFINNGIRDKDNALTNEFFGSYNLQGKPPNARKHVTVRESSAGEYLISTKLLEENVRLNNLILILGLNKKEKYDTPAAIAKLRYGGVIVAVDQDVDGVGHIFGLLLNFFHLFWPALISAGYIKRLATPLIMAYPQSKSTQKVLQFYSDTEYRAWLEKSYPGKKVPPPTSYHIQYYKGLAGHSKASTSSIFRNFDKNLYSYFLDDKSNELFEIYFGKDTDIRKTELRKPITEYIVGPDNRISCSQQLQRETKSFQFADILRSLPHIMDGQRPASRIAFTGARLFFGTKPEKVAVIANKTAGELGYEHATTSLEETIKRSSMDWPGSNNIPLFVPQSTFGSRSKGGNDVGASRYIFTIGNRKLNDILFPRVDDDLLEYRYEDGVKCEPKYYVPIVPLVLLENFKIPGTGWATSIWARDFDSVINNVRLLIDGETQLNYMPYWKLHSTCSVFEIGRKIILVADFTVSNNIITIKDLPPGVWPDIWKEKIDEYCEAKKDFAGVITKIINRSTDFNVYIEVHCATTVDLNEIASRYFSTSRPEIPGIARWLEIYIADHNMPNVLGADELVFETTKYDLILHTWFAERKRLYIARVERQIIIVRWKIAILSNIIRYINNCSKYAIANNSLANVTKILTGEKYDAINKEHVYNCKDCPTSELESYFLSGANYNYLLDLRDRDKLDDSKWNANKRDLEKQLAHLLINEGFPGAHIWLTELDELEAHVCECIAKKDWDFVEKKYIY